MDLEGYQPGDAGELLALWRLAAGAAFPIMPELWNALTVGDPSFRPGDLIVMRESGRALGFVLAKRYRGSFPGTARYAEVGYIALLAVAPAQQRRGVGTALLGAAEAALRAEGTRRVILGGSFHHVFAGVPDALGAALPFFSARGYTPGETVWDVSRDLGALPALPGAPLGPKLALRPYRPDEAEALVDFVKTHFPGRWAADVALFLNTGGPAETVMGLFSAGAPAGFAWCHPPRSAGALRWAGFDADVAALGPIGVAEAERGGGAGLALLAAGLRQLADHGARTTVIDWTTLLAFYARCGFAPWLSYRLASREL